MRVNYQTNATPRFRVLSDDQIDQVIYAALEILQDTGTRVYEDEALRLLRQAGCVIRDDNLVFLPSALVENSLKTLPSRIAVAGRDRNQRMNLQKDEIYYGTGSDCPFILDLHTGERRRFGFEDVYNAAKIADALPHIDFHMSLGLTSNVPIGTYDRHQFLAMVRGTRKPLVITAVDREGLADQLAMAQAVLGGADEWRRLPMFVLYIEPVSPLNNGQEAVQKLLYAAENDVPTIYTPCPICGATAPATMAGTLAQGLAECLTGVVLSQLKRPGAQIIIGGVMSPLDMATTILSYGAPELSLLSAAMTDITKRLRVPMFSTAGCSDAKTLDQQAALEAALSIAVAGLSGASLIHDIGFLESALIGSYEMVVLSNEVIGLVKRILRGIPVDAQHLALDAIARVGPGGHYLMDEHTLANFRSEFWRPELLDRANWEVWQADGARTMGTRLHDKVVELVEQYEPAPLTDDVEDRLLAIIQKADDAHRAEEVVTLA